MSRPFSSLARPPATLWHGTTQEAARSIAAGGFRGVDAYLTTSRQEALGYASGLHLGGSAGSPAAVRVRLRPGRVALIHAEVDEAVVDDDPVAAIDEVLEKARRLGFRYARFLHPGFGGGDQVVYVSLHPREDLELATAARRR